MTNIKSKKNNKKSTKQKGGDGYTFDVNRSIGGLMGRSRYSYNYAPVYYGDLLQNGGGKDCGCSTPKENNLYSLIKQNGGVKSGGTQVEAIQYISNLISPLGYESLISLILLIFTYHYFTKDGNTIKMKKGGYDVSSVLAPLGKSNLIVLAALLLLHHFAVELPKTKKVLKGGNNIFMDISNILKPIGLDSNGVSKILVDLQKAFGVSKNESNNKNIRNNLNNNTNRSNQNLGNKSLKNTNNKSLNISNSSNLQDYGNKTGGNALKNIIAPLGTNAFVASGLLVVLAKVLNKDQNKSSTNKKGGANTNFNKLINMITPISFSTFANESFIKSLLKDNKSIKNQKGGRSVGGLSGRNIGSVQDRIGSRSIQNRPNINKFPNRFDHANANLVPPKVGLVTGSLITNNDIPDPYVANVLNINKVGSEIMSGGKKNKKKVIQKEKNNKKTSVKNTKSVTIKHKSKKIVKNKKSTSIK